MIKEREEPPRPLGVRLLRRRGRGAARVVFSRLSFDVSSICLYVSFHDCLILLETRLAIPYVCIYIYAYIYVYIYIYIIVLCHIILDYFSLCDFILGARAARPGRRALRPQQHGQPPPHRGQIIMIIMII